jgi:N-acetylglucosaminyl-diphospho-decaprenol L-rhamnosyltransferase
MADLAVIIVSFNSAQYLIPCLESVYRHAGDIELDVAVVDNGSVDGSADLIEREFPQARVLRSGNRGFAHGNNRGFETVDSPFVLFLNPDTEIRDGAFDDLVRVLRERPSVGLLGCRHVSGDGTLSPTIRRFPTPMRYLFEALGTERFPIRAAWMGERELDPARYERETRCDWVAGSFMLARSEAVIGVGLMDERFFLYSEEADLCARINAAGWEVAYVPNMTILHHTGEDGNNPRLAAQDAYSRRQYLFKHEGIARRNLSTAALALYYVRRAVDSVARDPDARARRAAARAALNALLGIAPPPFGELSGPLRGPRLPARDPDLRRSLKVM